MKIKNIKEVMEKYGNAWENQSTDLLISCFTKNGIYQESLLSKPYVGHKEISNFWNKVVVKETNSIKFKLGNCYVSNDGKVGFAEWQCKNVHLGKKNYMVGIMLIRMKGDKITYLNEYWNVKIK